VALLAQDLCVLAGQRHRMIEALRSPGLQAVAILTRTAVRGGSRQYSQSFGVASRRGGGSSRSWNEVDVGHAREQVVDDLRMATMHEEPSSGMCAKLAARMDRL
jgi:hypothetical protein